MVQFEITTRCNFDCFYCAGRHMRQGDMPYETFTAILERDIATHGIPDVVSLQGEGEPTLHHDFLRMAEFVRGKGATPYTITNGTYKHPDRLIGLFPKVGVSIDTLDEVAGEKIGRHNLPRVLSFVEALAPHLQVIIHSVTDKQHTPRIAQWCQDRGLKHIMQPLQRKPDYSRYYGTLPATSAQPQGRFSCGYLARPRMRYYNLDGLEMPCCYIKDTSVYEGPTAMARHQEEGTWPKCCTGCRYAHEPRQTARPEVPRRTEVGLRSRK